MCHTCFWHTTEMYVEVTQLCKQASKASKWICNRKGTKDSWCSSPQFALLKIYLVMQGSLVPKPSQTPVLGYLQYGQAFSAFRFWSLAVFSPCNFNGYYYILLTTTAKQRAGMRQMNAGRLPCRKQSTIITKVRTMWLLARLWTTSIFWGGAEGWFTTTAFWRGLTRKQVWIH